MPKFNIEETVACWVTWRCEIEAESAEEAQQIFFNDRPICEEPVIGDSLDSYDSQIAVTVLPNANR